MARKCVVCSHKDKQKIDFALINGKAYRSIAKQYNISPASVYRHKQEHLPEKLEKAKVNKEIEQADRVMEELERCLKRVNLLFDSCHEWLLDPANPGKYSLVPRGEEIDVIYLDHSADDGTMIKKKTKLSALLAMIQSAGGVHPVAWETKTADPRELILKTAGRLGDFIELLKEIKNMGAMEKEIAELREVIDEMKGKKGKQWA